MKILFERPNRCLILTVQIHRRILEMKTPKPTESVIYQTYGQKRKSRLHVDHREATPADKDVKMAVGSVEWLMADG